MYEVLKFIEHGAHCRQSMDCIRGTILIRYLRENPRIGKAELFGWFRQLCVCVDQYHRCRSLKEYRYLNPYSVIVSEEGELFLLDLEAPENAFVMKQMQKRAVRSHFVKPVCRIEAGGGQKADLFAYGKTIQFLLAYTDPAPRLTRLEEARLSRIIDRCMGVGRKGYEDIGQVIKSLPSVKQEPPQSLNRRRTMLLALAAGCICVSACALLIPGRDGAASGEESTFLEEKQGEAGEPVKTDVVSAPEEEAATEKEILERTEQILEQYVSGGAEKDIYTALELGREIELDTVRCLSGLYEKLGMAEEAADAYDRLIRIEEEPERIEAAGLSKMRLEAGRKEYLKAAATGADVLERIEGSEEIEELLEQYKKKADPEIKSENAP